MHTRHTPKLALGLILAMSGGLSGCGLEPIGDGGEADELPAAVQAAFDESCATSPGCHAGGAPQVVLAAPESIEVLMKSSATGGGPLITFGDLEASYLAQKLLGGPGITGGQMPPSPQSDRDDINKAIIIGWIAGVMIDEGDAGDGDGDPTGDGDGDPGMTCYIDGPLPDTFGFETEIWPIVEARCGVMGCHANILNPLMPDASTAYTNLVDMPAGTAALDYIEPGMPDSSYMWHKLMNTQTTVPGGGGFSMPSGGSLCAIEMQAIYAWITDGAAP